MLRDAIYSLLGFGSKLCYTEEGLETPTVRDLIHGGEIELYHRIDAISQCYVNIKNFADSTVRESNNQPTTASTESVKDTSVAQARRDDEPEAGFYLLAFRECLRELLIPYYQEISALETKALMNPRSVSLMLIVSVAEKYTELFRQLSFVVNQIKEQNIHGCAILNFLYPYLDSGIEQIENAFDRLVHNCQIVMVNQLSNWLMYGILSDPFKEFFIQNTGAIEADRGPDKKLEAQQNQWKGLDWSAHYQYRLEPLLLPSCIRHSLASKILYIGRMIRMFGNNPGNVLQLGVEQDETLLGIWGDKEDNYLAKLRSFQEYEQAPLNVLWLEQTVEELRADVMKHMWQLIIEDARLSEEIELMKDIFLMGRGELFLVLLHKTEGVRQEPFYKATNKDVQAAFKVAVHTVLPNDETISEKFKFCCELPEGSDEDVFKDKDGWWHYMCLKYTVHWPLQLMFKPVILDNYNIIFRFLFRLKKTLVDLHHIWQEQMKTKCKLGITSRPPKFWLLQHNLINLLNNIQYYLQFSVIEPLYKELQVKLQKCMDIEEIAQAHMSFQASVMRQFFLMMRQVPECKMDNEEEYTGPVPQTNLVHKSMMSILQISEKFCNVGKMWGNELSEKEEAVLDSVFHEFESSVAFFMDLVSCVQDRHIFLFQLCVQLDFNEQFTFKSDPKSAKAIGTRLRD